MAAGFTSKVRPNRTVSASCTSFAKMASCVGSADEANVAPKLSGSRSRRRHCLRTAEFRSKGDDAVTRFHRRQVSRAPDGLETPRH